MVSSIFVLEGITLPKPSLLSLVSTSLPSRSYLFIYLFDFHWVHNI